MSHDFAPMSFHLETARLSLRPWAPEDTSWHRDLVTERGGEMPTAEADRAVIASARDQAARLGISTLVVVRRAQGDVIGYCGLIVGRATLEEPEIAYELFWRTHGRGYATEAAHAVLAAAIATGRRRLWSTVRMWNHPSFRVLEKLGFRRDHSTFDERGEVVWNVRDLP